MLPRPLPSTDDTPYHKREAFAPDLQRLASQLKALSHPARLAIVQALSSRGTCVCGQLVELLPLSQGTVSRHLKELKEAGLIQGSLEGPSTCYCLAPQAFALLRKLFDDFTEPCCPPGCC